MRFLNQNQMGVFILNKKNTRGFAVSTGCLVYFSNNLWKLFFDSSINPQFGWSSRLGKIGEWIQVSCEDPKYWCYHSRKRGFRWVCYYLSSWLPWTGHLGQCRRRKIFTAKYDRKSKMKISFKYSTLKHGTVLYLFALRPSTLFENQWFTPNHNIYVWSMFEKKNINFWTPLENYL